MKIILTLSFNGLSSNKVFQISHDWAPDNARCRRNFNCYDYLFLYVVHDKGKNMGEWRKGGTKFFVGKGQKRGHPTKAEGLFEILGIREKSLPFSFPLSGSPETISYLNWPRKGCPVKPDLTSFTENISTT